MDVDMIFFHLITALPFPLQNLVQRLRSQTPSSVSSTPNEVSAIPCELFGNTLRALFLKNRDFFWYCEIFLPNKWLGDFWDASSGFGRLGQNPAGQLFRINKHRFKRNFYRDKNSPFWCMKQWNYRQCIVVKPPNDYSDIFPVFYF